MVKLVRFSEAHMGLTWRWLTMSPQLREQIDCIAAPSRSENEAYWRAKLQDKTREDYAITDDSLDHIGNCGLSEIDAKRKKAQLWIYIGQNQGRGHGKEAVRVLLSRAFEELRLERIYLRVLVTNPHAYRFYKALGFVEEGCMRHDTVHEEEYVDSVLLSMLSAEFKTSELGNAGNAL
jgi:RimJ/RimL family protein N-acetyltransferase